MKFQYIYNRTTRVLTNMVAYFFVPKVYENVGNIINGQNYSSNDLHIYNSLTIGSKTFKRTNCYIIYLEVLDIFKTDRIITFCPYMINKDGTRVESSKIFTLRNISENDNPTVDDTEYEVTNNPNYPTF